MKKSLLCFSLLFIFLFTGSSLIAQITSLQDFEQKEQECIERVKINYQNIFRGMDLQFIPNDLRPEIEKSRLLKSDSKGFPLKERIFQEYEKGIWVDKFKDELNYNASNHLALIYQYIFTEPGRGWELSGKSEYTNNASGYPLTVIQYVWNDIASLWEESWKDTYLYLPTGDIALLTMQFWSGSEWINMLKIEYQYGAGDMLQDEYSYNWDFKANQWVNSQWSEFEYNANDWLSEEYGHYWVDPDWVDDFYNAFTYDAQGHLLNIVEQWWYGTSWENEYKTSFSYDGSWRQVEALSQHWSGTMWDNNSKGLFYYNANGWISEDVYQTWADGWMNEFRVLFYYYPVGIFEPIAQADQLMLKVSPNPLTDFGFIDFRLEQENHVEIQIIDLSGKSVRALASQSMPAGKHQVSWNGKNEQGAEVAAGLYFLKLQAGELTSTVSIIKQ